MSNAYESVDITSVFDSLNVWGNHIFVIHDGACIATNTHLTGFGIFSAPQGIADGVYEVKSGKIALLGEHAAKQINSVLSTKNLSLGYCLYDLLDMSKEYASRHERLPDFGLLENRGGVGKITKAVASALEKEGLYIGIFSHKEDDRQILLGSIAPDIEGLREICGPSANVLFHGISPNDFYSVMKFLGKGDIYYAPCHNSVLLSTIFPYPMFVLAGIEIDIWKSRATM